MRRLAAGGGAGSGSSGGLHGRNGGGRTEVEVAAAARNGGRRMEVEGAATASAAGSRESGGLHRGAGEGGGALRGVPSLARARDIGTTGESEEEGARSSSTSTAPSAAHRWRRLGIAGVGDTRVLGIGKIGEERNCEKN